MRYTLWSNDRLLGHTELDLPHVQDHVRMGFIAPTELGNRLLPDATCVPAAANALARAARRAANQREASLTEFADFWAACDRREALRLELRDETGGVFQCEWIRVNDIDNHSWSDDDVDDDVDDDLYDEFDDDDPTDPELAAQVEHDAALFQSWIDEDDLLDTSAWEPPDER